MKKRKTPDLEKYNGVIINDVYCDRSMNYRKEG